MNREKHNGKIPGSIQPQHSEVFKSTFMNCYELNCDLELFFLSLQKIAVSSTDCMGSLTVSYLYFARQNTA